MDKYLKYILIALAILLLINLVSGLFNSGDNNLKQAIENINKSQHGTTPIFAI